MGSKVGVFQRKGTQNQRWTLKAEKTFFYILGSDSGRVLDASLSCPGEVCLWVKNGQDNQLWYWDGPNGDVLRNKKFPNKVLDFDYNEYDRTRWGRVYLTSDYHGGWNQRFQFVGGEIACKGYGARSVFTKGLVGRIRSGNSHEKYSLPPYTKLIP